MYTSKSLLVFLALLVVFVTAHPIQHVHHKRVAAARPAPRRRAACRAPTGSTIAPAAGSAPTPVVVSDGNLNSNIKNSTAPAGEDVDIPAPPAPVKGGKDDDEEPTSTKPSSSSTAKPKPTSTKEDDEPAPTTSKPSHSGGSSNGKLSALFPVSTGLKSWTTSPLSDSPLPLSDGTLRPTRLLSALSHDFVSAPDGKKAMKAHYPKGSYTFTHQPQGGLSFYAPGPSSVDLSQAKEATFGYSVYFPAGFSFQKGGKLPGIYGGNSDDEAIGCSGGRRSTACFSARLMWRTAGKGEFYTYLPPYTDSRFAANKKQCNVAPESDCNPTYGASIGRGSFTFATGAWTTVSERVKLNDVGKANGELQLFVNGESVIDLKGLILRDSSAGKMRGIQMQTFFGGSSPDFASPKSQDVYFSDFSVAVLENL